MTKKKVPPSLPLPQELQDEVIEEAYANPAPSEGIIPEEPPYEKEVIDTFYFLFVYIDEAEGPDNKHFKEVYDGILKQLEIFQDPVELKNILKRNTTDKKDFN
jgi:hypothetical protein